MTAPAPLADRPWYRLTAHFFLGLFDFGVLSATGSDAFRRVLIGVAALMVTVGLLLTRMYMAKYAALSQMFTTRPPYLLARLGDDTLIIALPMLGLAIATLLISHSLFPDETDFRVLLPLPISRRVVFLSKLLALALFAGLFIVAALVAMAPLVVLTSLSRWSGQTILQRVMVYVLAGTGASAFAVLAVTAINGLLLVFVPRSRLQTASTAVRSAMLCALVLSLPLIARLPTIGPLVAAESRAMYLVPPVWFLGAERLLLGDSTPYVVHLAQIAAAAFGAVSAIALGSYTFLYRRFDRVILRPADASGDSTRRRTWFLRHLTHGRPAFAGIRDFTWATLARSPLHQGVFLAVTACGAGLVLNSVLGAALTTALRDQREALVGTVIWAPFALMFAMNLASRASLVLPVEPRANWVFRVTENDASRGPQLSAIVHTVVWLGVIVPLVALFPIQWAVLGPQSFRSVSVAFFCGLLLVELHLGEWRRISFTCSYVPGKRLLAPTILMGLAAFVGFTTIGSGLVRYSFAHPVGWLVVIGILGGLILQRRRQRRWFWQQTTLMFEDVLPNDVEPLQLSAD